MQINLNVVVVVVIVVGLSNGGRSFPKNMHQNLHADGQSIFCFQIKRTPWMAQLMAQFFPDRVILVRLFCLTISKFFHIYY